MPNPPTTFRIFSRIVIVAVALLIPTTLSAADPPLQVSTLVTDLDGAVGGVAVDALGFVYVADFGEKVWKITPWGEVEILADSLYGSSGNAIDLEGNLLQSNFNANTISRITRDGEITTFATGLSGPVGVAVATDGTVYACNCKSNAISRITPAGDVSDFVSGDLFNCPNGMTIDGDGHIYVVNFSDGRMIHITPEGETSQFATIPGGGNGHITFVGPDFYVAGLRANMIFRVDPDGKVSPAAGNGGFGEQDGEGAAVTFSTPNGIAYNPTRNILYTNDYLLPWPVRFEGRGRPKSSVRQIVFPTLRELAAWKFENEDVKAAKEAVRAFRSFRPGQSHEFAVNVVGYSFLRSEKVDEAIAIFELNTEFFPQSANVWDSLAQAHKAAGHKAEAIEHYRKSLEMNPNNTNAAAMLEELGAE